MDRRHFVILTGTGLTAFAHNWMLDPQRVAAAVAGTRVDHAVIDDLERVADARRRLDDAIGGDMVLRAVREDLRLVTEFRTAAQPYANTTQVKEFDTKFGDLLRPTAA